MKIDKAKIRETSEDLKKPAELSNRTSAFTDKKRSEITYLSVHQLIPYRNQARTIFKQEDIDSLAETIQEHGIRQPLTVLRIDGDFVQFEVVSGERRLRAAKQLEMPTVPCIVISDVEKAEEIALIENIQRQDLHPIELARTLKKLMDKIGYGAQSELKHKVGLSQSQISELVKLVCLSENVQNEILALGYRGRDNFRKLFQLNSEEEQLKLVRAMDYSKKSETTKRGNQRSQLISKSLLRCTLTESGIKIQKTKFSLLEPHDIIKLKETLATLIDELSNL